MATTDVLWAARDGRGLEHLALATEERAETGARWVL